VLSPVDYLHLGHAAVLPQRKLLALVFRLVTRGSNLFTHATIPDPSLPEGPSVSLKIHPQLGPMAFVYRESNKAK
jgi:hypothetical protein